MKRFVGVKILLSSLAILSTLTLHSTAVYAYDPDLKWTDISPYRPFGSVHDFGILALGDLTVGNVTSADQTGNVRGGYFHSEGGVAVAGNVLLPLYHTTLDFGEAHKGVGNQIPDYDYRLLISGNFYSTYAYDNVMSHRPPASTPLELVAIMHGGTIGISEKSDFRSRGPIETSQGTYGGVGSQKDENGYVTSWPNISRLSDEIINTFFATGDNNLRWLSNYFANVTTDNGGQGVHIGNVIPGASWEYTKLEMPTEATELAAIDTIIFNLANIPNGGDIPALNFDFPAEFEGNVVVNIPIGGTARIAHANQITTANTGYYELARAYSGRIIYNFIGAGEIQMTYHAVTGSILALDADFLAPHGGSIDGEMMVRNLTHLGGGFEQHTTSFHQLGGISMRPWWPIEEPEVEPEMPDVTPPMEPEIDTGTPEVIPPSEPEIGPETPETTPPMEPEIDTETPEVIPPSEPEVDSEWPICEAARTLMCIDPDNELPTVDNPVIVEPNPDYKNDRPDEQLPQTSAHDTHFIIFGILLIGIANVVINIKNKRTVLSN